MEEKSDDDLTIEKLAAYLKIPESKTYKLVIVLE
jgi:hypothetical protein